MVRVRAAFAVIALLATTGCSGGDESPGDPAEIRADLAAIFAGDHPEARQRDDGQCFAKAFTGSTSQAEMRDGGLLDDDGQVVDPIPALSPELAEAWVQAQFGCTDFVAESTRAQVAVSHGSLDTEAYAACLSGALTEQQLRDAVAATLQAEWDAPELERLSEAQADCYAQTKGQA